MIWNFGVQLLVSNPNFRDAGVQNAVYQVIVNDFGSPLMRLGAYGDGEKPTAVDGDIVNAVWDLGAAFTACRNLGVNESTYRAPSGRTTTDFIGDATVTSFGRVVGKGTVDIRSTIEGIENGTVLPRTEFNNKEGLLPSAGKGYYKEFVLPTPGVNGVGSQRIIRGDGGEYYYTPDHYHTFIHLN